MDGLRGHGGSNGLRAHFTRATISAPPAVAAAREQPLAPIEHRRLGAIPSSHLGGIGLDRMLAFLAPHDQPDLGSGTEHVVGYRRTWARNLALPTSARAADRLSVAENGSGHANPK
jgi:hypothetical protein